MDGEQLLKSLSPGINERINCSGPSCSGNDVFLSSGEVRPSVLEENDSVGIKPCAFTSPVADEAQSSLAIIASNCDNEDWHLVTGEQSNSVQKPRKFKRLRKIGETEKNENMKSTENTSVSPLANIVGNFSSTRRIKKKKPNGIFFFPYSSSFGESLSVPNIEYPIEHTSKQSNPDLVANLLIPMLHLGERRFDDNVRAFIEEEAE